ncbi:hypothetical protein SAMN05216561_1132 [Nocardioides psychrotolerans]|uniref:Uncharacterized protein n=3 Tax=Nocardioides psychrotolerans TaxID=1005945 RepID=A0A1I3L248_9ACTN|nr:hypothetical protein SAMN05216561_1132 [Nocardioides psychrotolerans]
MRKPKLRFSDYPLPALIREAPLTTQEKTLLFVIVSHKNQKSYARAGVLQQQTGLGRTSFYDVRGALKERGILAASESPGGATTYTVRRGPLEKLLRDTNRGSGVLSRGTTAAATGQATHTVTRHPTPAVKRHQKQNTKVNTEESMNMKGTAQALVDTRGGWFSGSVCC